MHSLKTEVTIVGAGPAGCFLSVLLARSGVQVTLLEQHPTFDREFRGNAFQPSVLKILDRMGLGGLLGELDHEAVKTFQIRDRHGVLFTLPLGDLPPPYNFAFITPQTPLLIRLVQEAGRYPNFRFIGGCPVEGVVMEQGAVAGVIAHIRNQPCLLRSRLVVAADGRFSALRRDLGIGLGRSPQSFDFVWFEMPRVTDRQHQLGLTLEDQGILINLPKERGTSQVGWVIPKGGFAALRRDGLQKFFERVGRVEPELAAALPGHLQSFDQCRLLDVKIAEAETWAQDGLLLIGDAAHTASPIGAQGNKLAIEDAALAHPLVLDALRGTDGVIAAAHFHPFVTRRRADVAQLLSLQKILGRVVIGPRQGWVRALRRMLLRVLDRTPLKRLMVRNMALGPHPVEVAAGRFDHGKNEDPSQIFHPLKVKKIITETAWARTLVLDIPEPLRPLFRYKPGQFVTVRVLNKGVLARRCYSLSSAPGVDADWQITVKWVVNGCVSTWLVKELAEGGTLWVLPPGGAFVHEPDPARPRHHVLFAAGSGITPVYSILKSVLATEPESRVTLIYGNHDEASVIFRAGLDALAERENGRLALTHRFTRLTEEAVAAVLDRVEAESPVEREFYVCGPQGMMDVVTASLKKRKVNPARIHFEKFVSLYGEEEMVEAGDAAEGLEVGESDGTGTEIPERARIKINGQEHAVPIRKDETVLAAALRAGLPAPYSCESGLCATCTAKLVSGRVRMEHHDALSDQDVQRRNILTCQAVQLTREAFVDYDVL